MILDRLNRMQWDRYANDRDRTLKMRTRPLKSEYRPRDTIHTAELSREREHDAGLRKDYKEFKGEVEHAGGRILWTQTEKELKQQVGAEIRKRTAERGFFPDEDDDATSLRQDERWEIARMFELQVVHGRIRIPDIQAAVERSDGSVEIVSLERATASYGRAHLETKRGMRVRGGSSASDWQKKGRARDGPSLW